MADSKITDLNELSSVIHSDLAYVIDDPSGTPASRKITAANLLRGNVYQPKYFGAAADGTSDDTSVLQDAIDAIESEGGGTLDLAGGTYGYNITNSYGVAGYSNILYGLLVSNDNVFIKGSGKLKLLSMPDVSGGKRPIGILFNATGAGSYPGRAGTWIENVGITKVHFDNTNFTKAQLQTITAGLSSCVNFAHARGFVCAYNTITKGFGEGAIGTILGSVGGSIHDNVIYGAARCGMWLDGLAASTVYANKVLGNLYWMVNGNEYNVEVAGINFAANSDNQTGSEFNEVNNNILVNCKGGAVVGVIDTSRIHHNFALYNDGTGLQPFVFSYTHNANGLWTCDDLRIDNNTVISDYNIPTGKAFYVYGATSSPYDASTIEQQRIIITGNRANSNWGTEIEFGEEVHNSFAINNFINGNTVTEDASCTGNTLTPNY